MLNQNEGHPRIWRQCFKKLGAGVEPARRRANTDNEKTSRSCGGEGARRNSLFVRALSVHARACRLTLQGCRSGHYRFHFHRSRISLPPESDPLNTAPYD
jgi:hypothetical protein